MPFCTLLPSTKKNDILVNSVQNCQGKTTAFSKSDFDKNRNNITDQLTQKPRDLSSFSLKLIIRSPKISVYSESPKTIHFQSHSHKKKTLRKFCEQPTAQHSVGKPNIDYLQEFSSLELHLKCVVTCIPLSSIVR